MVALIEEIRHEGDKLSRPQRRVRVLTADPNSALHECELRAVANFTFNPKQAESVLTMLNQRLHEDGKNLGHVVKALKLLNYLLRFGSVEVLNWYDENRSFIESLEDFHERDIPYETAYEIQDAAKKVVSLTADRERLEKIRTKADLVRKEKNHADDLRELRIQDICFAPPEYALHSTV